MKRYVLTKDLQKIANIKGQILKRTERIVFLKTLDIYTVWIPSEGFQIVNTYDFNEADLAFEKFLKIGD